MTDELALDIISAKRFSSIILYFILTVAMDNTLKKYKIKKKIKKNHSMYILVSQMNIKGDKLLL